MKFIAVIRSPEGERREIEFSYDYDAAALLAAHVEAEYLEPGEVLERTVGTPRSTTVPNIVRIG